MSAPDNFAEDILTLRNETSSLTVRHKGAEPLSWRVDGRDVLWRGDSEWWDRSAPVLFPVVGAVVNGAIAANGRRYVMPQHGFAKDYRFTVSGSGKDYVSFYIEDDDDSRRIFPFSFRLKVDMILGRRELNIVWEVMNTGGSDLPYALGFHPGFLWSSATGQVIFEQDESADIPRIVKGGLLSRKMRKISLHGRRLPLTDTLFDHGALVFRHARSRTISLSDPEGRMIEMRCQGFPDLAVWSKPHAPFVSLEAWTGHADWEDFCGELMQKYDMLILKPGEIRQHSVSLEVIATCN